MPTGWTSHEANAWRKKYGYKYPLGVIPPEWDKEKEKEQKKFNKKFYNRKTGEEVDRKGRPVKNGINFKNRVKAYAKMMGEATERFKVGDLVHPHSDPDHTYYGKIIDIYGTTAKVKWNNGRIEQVRFIKLDKFSPKNFE